MKKYHPKYKIDQGDTLQSITEIFGVELDKWKRYHNNMCRLDDIIMDALPKHLTEIYLLPELWDKVQELNRISHLQKKISNSPSKVIFGYDETLFLKPISRIKKYGVKILIQKGEITKSIKYEIDLKWLGVEDDNHIVELSKISAVFIDDVQPDLIMDRLATEIFGKIYPISLSLNRKGQIADIYNFNDIQLRWENVQNEIRKGRKGEWIEKYIKLTGKSFLNKKIFLEKLLTNWHLHSLFLGIHQTYTRKYFIENIISFPMVQGIEPIQYNTKQEVSQYLDNYGMIQVKITGKSIDQRSIKDIEYKLNVPNFPEEEKLRGEYIAKYFIDPTTNIIDASITECSLELNTKKNITIKISSII